MPPDKPWGKVARAVFVVGFLQCSALPSAGAKVLLPFERDAFRKISFSEHCLEQQWTTLPDNALELQFTPSPDEACEVTLEFHFPQSVHSLSALNFEVRGSHRGAYLRMGIQDASGHSWVLTPPFPPSGVSTRWHSDGIRLNHLRDEWTPKSISAIRIVALPYTATPSGSPPTLFIREIHLATPEAPLSVESPTSPMISLPHSHPTAQKNMRGSKLYPLRKGTKAGLVVGFLGLVYLFLRKKPPVHRRIISPLYEMNTRTWKSWRDPEGVLQLGGFKNITENDLRSIKNAGFNALWLMGIWEIGSKVRAISRNYGSDYAGSPFAISDYRVSEELGTEEDFRALVERAHHLRLSVLVDFVPNHMGLDSTWLNDHPEYFIHKVVDPGEACLPDDELARRYPGHFAYRTPAYPVGEGRVPQTIMVAYGKDPYFYPWIDTAQLDYAHPELRQKMIDVLTTWAPLVDGVRCDMAMLVLREQVKIHRHPEMSWPIFDQRMPGEFWTEAIAQVKRVNPNFVFLAETYWAMEGYLQQLGFDYTYNKPLYDAVCNAFHSGHAEGLLNFLRMLGSDFLQKGVHFIENHDEERAMNALGEERQRAAASLVCTLPGVALLHQGQLNGKRERLPVQRIVPVHKEPENLSLQTFYQGLLKIASLPLFQEGRLTVLYSNNPAFASYARIRGDEKAVVIINTSNQPQTGSIFFTPGLRLRSGTPYRLKDYFYPLKTADVLDRSTVRPHYVYPASQLINQGLYVELQAFDAHIFLLEPHASAWAQQAAQTLRQWTEEWPLHRLARRALGLAYSRSSDSDFHQSV